VALILARPPEFDGLAATASIRQHLQSCRVIVLTDEGDQHILRRAIEAGAAGYVTKYIPLTELTAAIAPCIAATPWFPRRCSDGCSTASSLSDACRARPCGCCRD
jgi:DNA-binding NarL/FixJ family response regulator